MCVHIGINSLLGGGSVKKFLCVICIFVLVMAFPYVSMASDNIVESPVECDDVQLIVYDKNWNWITSASYSVGSYFNLTYPVNDVVSFVPVVDIWGCLTDTQKYLLNSSVDTTLSMVYSIDFSSDPSRSGYLGYSRLIYSKDNGDVVENTFGSAELIPNNLTSSVHLGDYFYNGKISKFQLELFNNVYFNVARQYDMQFALSSLSIVLSTVGVDKSTADIVINMGKIEDSLNQGFDNMGDKLDGVQDSINQGFDNVLTPDANDKNNVDKFEGEVTDKKEESDKLIGELDKLDKPELSDDDLDPMQGISEDDVSFVGDTFGAIFESRTLARFMSMSIIFAFLGYILFGKRV